MIIQSIICRPVQLISFETNNRLLSNYSLCRYGQGMGGDICTNTCTYKIYVLIKTYQHTRNKQAALTVGLSGIPSEITPA